MGAVVVGFKLRLMNETLSFFGHLCRVTQSSSWIVVILRQRDRGAHKIGEELLTW